MIPKVKTWYVTDTVTGEVFILETINRRMARLIIKMDYPRTWGHKLVISTQLRAAARLKF